MQGVWGRKKQRQTTKQNRVNHPQLCKKSKVVDQNKSKKGLDSDICVVI